ncbi:hypothetical protein B0H14DRAFT_1460585 [Mycena olivaceomarginata]|nr:hypothetical protein B0H14DRAFT_1460585 [Mycena olivaceomarginata]
MNHDNYDNYDRYDRYDHYGIPWGTAVGPAPQQTAVPEPSQFLPNYYVPGAQHPVLHDAHPTQFNVYRSQNDAYPAQNDAYPAQNNAYPARNSGLAQDMSPVPVLHVSAPKTTRKQPANGPKETNEPKYSARNLLDIVQNRNRGPAVYCEAW